MSKLIRPSTKDSIIEAAFLLVSRNPGVSLSEIAELAGVGRATLHRYFPNRDDLIHTLALIAIQEMDAAAETATTHASSYTEALRLSLNALIPLGDRHGFLSKEPLTTNQKIAREFERLDRETNELIEAAKGEGFFDQAIPTSWIALVFDSLLYAGWESVRSGHATESQACDLAWLTLCQGLGVQKNEH